MIARTLSIALIVGCARSGTSIFAEAISAHPDVQYVFEPHEIWELAGNGENGSHRLTAQHATPDICAHLREWFTARQGGAALILDKTLRNALRVMFLRAVFPEARFIHIVRDGRDVACSLMPGVGGDTWNHLKPVAWHELQTTWQGIERCALVWRDVVQTACADLAGVPHLQVRYEELIAAPRETVIRTWQYLGLPANPSMLGFADRISDATAGSFHAAKQTFWYREDHTHRVGRWRENLTAEQQLRVNALLADTLNTLGYG